METQEDASPVLKHTPEISDPKIQERLDRRAFTRSTSNGRQLRQETALQIREERKNLQRVRREISDITYKRQQTNEYAKHLQDLINQYRSKIEAQKRELQDRETNFVKRVVGFFRSSSANLPSKDTGQSEADAEVLEATLRLRYAEMTRMDNELQSLINSKKSMKDGRQVLSDFYREAGYQLHIARNLDDLEKFKEEYGTVEYNAKLQNVYYLHGTHPGILGGQNNQLLKEGTTWDQKLAVLIQYQPTVSASSIGIGGCRNLWAGVGVIYNRGTIVETSFTDSGSKALSVKNRVPGTNLSKSIEDYRRNLYTSSNLDRYNELILGGDPEISGLYINFDSRNISETCIIYGDPKSNSGTSKLYFSQIFDIANWYGLKVFGLKNGLAYRLSIDSKTGKPIFGEYVSPKSMLDEKYEIPEEKKELIEKTAQNRLTPAAFV